MKKTLILFLLFAIILACDQETVSPPGVYLSVGCDYGLSCPCGTDCMPVVPENTYEYIQIKDLNTDTLLYENTTNFHLEGFVCSPREKKIYISLPQSGEYTLGFYIGDSKEQLSLYRVEELNYTENESLDLGYLCMYRCTWQMECCTQSHCVPEYDYATGEKIDFDPFIGEGIHFYDPRKLFLFDGELFVLDGEQLIQVNVSSGDRLLTTNINANVSSILKINKETYAFLIHQSDIYYKIIERNLNTSSSRVIVTEIPHIQDLELSFVYLNNQYYSSYNDEWDVISFEFPKDIETDIIKINPDDGSIETISSGDIGTGETINYLIELWIWDDDHLLAISYDLEIFSLIKVNIHTGDRTLIDTITRLNHNYISSDKVLFYYDSSTQQIKSMDLITKINNTLSNALSQFKIGDLVSLGNYVYYTIPEQRAIYQIDLINNETSILSYSDCGETDY